MDKTGRPAKGDGAPKQADVVSFAAKARQKRRVIADAGRHDTERSHVSGHTQEPVRPSSAALIMHGAMRRRLAGFSRSPDGQLPVDDELAKLVYDSQAGDGDAREPAVRSLDPSVSATRQLTFEGPDLLLEVQVDGRRRELVCQVVPPQPATLEVRHAKGCIDLGPDPFGTFHSPELPAGAVSLRCVQLSGRAASTATSWLTL
ncbi:MAG: hypothetical protein ACRD0Z_03705 [Acidimicrobiales bacterium]